MAEAELHLNTRFNRFLSINYPSENSILLTLLWRNLLISIYRFKDLELPDEILAAMIFRDHQMIIPTAMTACSLTTTLTSSARRKI